jgi:hypothetical protein
MVDHQLVPSKWPLFKPGEMSLLLDTPKIVLLIITDLHWLVVEPTPLKNMSQLG